MAQTIIKPHEIEPGNEKAFSREEFLTTLDDMTREATTPLVLALHGSWGTGKTHLLKTWCKKLESEERPYVYFNAWEHDHGDDPFVSFVGEVQEAAGKYNRELVKSFVTKAVNALPSLVKIGAQVGVNVGLNALGVDKEILTGKALCDAMGEQIKKYTERKKSIQSFKDSLTDLADKIGAKCVTENSEIKQPPLIILVDELDRCRPSYAISLLERVKHILSVKHVIFLFAVDMVQLRETARCLYGKSMDTEGYFRRFFDISITLPTPDAMARTIYTKHIIDSLGIVEQGLAPHDIIDEFCTMCRLLNLTLREQATIAVHAKFCVAGLAQLNNSIDIALMMLSLKVKFKSAYIHLVAGKCGREEFLSIIRSLSVSEDGRTFPSKLPEFGYILMALFVAFGGSNLDVDAIVKSSESSSTLKRLFSYLANGNEQTLTHEASKIRTLARRIELIME